MYVSVIIPARNAAQTIAETLESLRSQTSPEWEALVIDDGSSDATAAISDSFAAQDARIRVVSRPHEGVCAARNAGIGLAQFDWLLFLDADDWLSPSFLERMTREIALDPNLGGVHCGWRRVAPDGTVHEGEFCNQDGDLFDLFACVCAFAIHTCIIRKSLVEAVGAFDTSLRVCEDWDLWQRITRTGARFAAVREALAFYRMRPDSASVNGRQSFIDGVRVIEQGHAPDPRVPNPHPAHANGRSASHVANTKFLFACWSAGLMLGNGEDPMPLLSALREQHYPTLDAQEVMESILHSALFPKCRPPVAWIEMWPKVEQRLDAFLAGLESQSLAPRLARRVRAQLERKILDSANAPHPLTIGTACHVRIEATEPIDDFYPPAAAESVRFAIDCEGDYLGSLYLPVCDGLVSRSVLADAIAADFAWPILGRVFNRTVYRGLDVERSPDGASIRRGALLLGELSEADDEREFWSQAHDRIGWVVFLQEIWGRPDWPDARFYEPWEAKEEAPLSKAEDGWLVIEVSEALPDVEISRPELTVVFMVGGVPLGVVVVPVKENNVRSGDLRAALNVACGFELCRVAVREGLLGKPFATDRSLRALLAARAAALINESVPAAKSAEFIKTENDLTAIPALAPAAERALHRALSSGEPGLVLGRRVPETIGASASRWAMLPAAARRELLDAASVTGEPAIRIPRGNGRGCVVYAPDLLCRPSRSAPASTTLLRAGAIQSEQAVDNLMNYFDGLFAAQSDPWRYSSPYEQKKYEQTLELLPPRRPRRALEVGCAEGHFTRQLAPRVEDLLAADISWIALDRAAKRCAGLGNVRFMQIDILSDPLPGRFDLIVCSEMLYYMDSLPALRAFARKLADALEPGGYLLTAHSNLVVDEPDRPGFDWDCPFGGKIIGETIAATDPLRLAKELRTPLYRVQLFRRERRAWFNLLRRKPQVIELAEQPVPVPADVAARVLWQGGSPRPENAQGKIVTDRLPILMYHRVAPTGAAATGSYRVTPEKFEEQLGYLRDAGYYSIGLEDWQAAITKKRPLPGKAVILTFDDGYRDFLEYAWPLLKRYGFSAIVFLVTDEIGRSNSWDHAFGEEVPLLGWPEIRQLRSEGVEFGSHSATHPPLTGVSVTEVVREGARSRAILERELKEPIRAFAYPYGDVDPVVQHLIGACGYVFGLSCEPGPGSFQNPLLLLPRIEVIGSGGMGEFVSQLS